MTNAGNVVLMWCKIKGFVYIGIAAILSIFLVRNLITMATAKKASDRDRAKKGAIFGAIAVAMLTGFYFLLQTNIGCGLSVVGNAATLFRG